MIMGGAGTSNEVLCDLVEEILQGQIHIGVPSVILAAAEKITEFNSTLHVYTLMFWSRLKRVGRSVQIRPRKT